MRNQRATLGYCRRRHQLRPSSTAATSQPRPGSVSPMFLPQDLTPAERDLVEAVTRDLIARRSPSSPSEEEADRHEASQVAAKMILETRGQSQAPTDEE